MMKFTTDYISDFCLTPWSKISCYGLDLSSKQKNPISGIYPDGNVAILPLGCSGTGVSFSSILKATLSYNNMEIKIGLSETSFKDIINIKKCGNEIFFIFNI